jgi:hypothetical protein
MCSQADMHRHLDRAKQCRDEAREALERGLPSLAHCHWVRARNAATMARAARIEARAAKADPLVSISRGKLPQVHRVSA